MINKIAYVFWVVAGIIIGSSCGGQRSDHRDNEIATESKPINLTQEMFEAKVASIADYKENFNDWKYLGDKPCIIKFGAEWCGPCQMMAPVLDEAAARYAGDIYVYSVDIDREPKLTEIFGVQKIPAFLFIPLKKQPQRATGLILKGFFFKRINDILLEKE